MNVRIAYYVVAIAISIAAFAGAYGESTGPRLEVQRLADAANRDYAASNREYEAALAASGVAADAADRATPGKDFQLFRARDAAAARLSDAERSLAYYGEVAQAANNARTRTGSAVTDVPAYALASAVSLAAFAGAFILDRRTQPRPAGMPLAPPE